MTRIISIEYTDYDIYMEAVLNLFQNMVYGLTSLAAPGTTKPFKLVQNLNIVVLVFLSVIRELA